MADVQWSVGRLELTWRWVDAKKNTTKIAEETFKFSQASTMIGRKMKACHNHNVCTFIRWRWLEQFHYFFFRSLFYTIKIRPNWTSSLCRRRCCCCVLRPCSVVLRSTRWLLFMFSTQHNLSPLNPMLSSSPFCTFLFFTLSSLSFLSRAQISLVSHPKSRHNVTTNNNNTHPIRFK